MTPLAMFVCDHSGNCEHFFVLIKPAIRRDHDDYMELACKIANLLNQGLDPDMLRRQLANVPGDTWGEQLFEQEAAA